MESGNTGGVQRRISKLLRVLVVGGAAMAASCASVKGHKSGVGPAASGGAAGTSSATQSSGAADAGTPPRNESSDPGETYHPNADAMTW